MEERRTLFLFGSLAMIVVAGLVFALDATFGRDALEPVIANQPALQIAASVATPYAQTVRGSDAFVHGPGWERVAGRRDGRFQGASLRSFRTGAVARLDFNGNAIRVFGIVGPSGGIADVTIDGRRDRKADFFLSRKATHWLVYVSPQLGPGTHRLSITVAPDRNASTGRYVNIDGVEYDS